MLTMLGSLATKIGLYLELFGLMDCCRLFFFRFFIMTAKRSMWVRLPGYAPPIFIRANSSDWDTFVQVFVKREYATPHLPDSPRLIIDGGANVGYASIYFANRFPSAKIYAIEPEKSNYQTLILNTQAYQNIEPIQAALWPSNTQLSIVNPNAEKYAIQVSSDDLESNKVVEGVTLMHLFTRAKSQRIDILKLDIEGSEKELFESDADVWLMRTTSIVIELHDWLREGCANSFYCAISQHRFAQHQLGENLIILMQQQD